MTPQELKAAIDRLGMTQAAFAARLSDLSGRTMSATYISDMVSDRPGSRDPSALVRVAVRLMLEIQDAERLRRAVERAGWKRER